jgi:hypothetical protein
MEVLVTEFDRNAKSTASMLYVDGKFVCFILEDAIRPTKLPGITAIPGGRYKLVRRTYGKFFERYSKKYKHTCVYEIQNVPDYKDVLIHMGNTVMDTLGCLLTGIGICKEKMEYKIPSGKSAPGYLAFYNALDGYQGEMWVTISRRENI